MTSARPAVRFTDSVEVRYLWVPDGEVPDPTELAKFSDPIWLRARYEPIAGGDRENAQPGTETVWEPDRVLLRVGAREHSGASESQIGFPVETTDALRPVQPLTIHNDPVAAYLRVNDLLDRMGYGHWPPSTIVAGHAPRELHEETQSSVEVPDLSSRTPSSKDSPQDPAAPVPLVDDRGVPILDNKISQCCGPRT